jgi:hypothetical protein
MPEHGEHVARDGERDTKDPCAQARTASARKHRRGKQAKQQYGTARREQRAALESGGELGDRPEDDREETGCVHWNAVRGESLEQEEGSQRRE